MATNEPSTAPPTDGGPSALCYIDAIPSEMVTAIIQHLVESIHLYERHPGSPDRIFGVEAQVEGSRRRQLRILCLTSKRLRAHAAPFLYRAVAVTIPPTLARLVGSRAARRAMLRFTDVLVLDLVVCRHEAAVDAQNTTITTAAAASSSSSSSGSIYTQLAEALISANNIRSLTLALRECIGHRRQRALSRGGSGAAINDDGPSKFSLAVAQKLAERGGGGGASLLLPRLATLHYHGSRRARDLRASLHWLLALPSLRTLVVTHDPLGAWGALLGASSRCGPYAHVTALALHRSGAAPADLHDVCRVFPALRALRVVSDRVYSARRMHALAPGDVRGSRHLSAGLAALRHLVELELDTHHCAVVGRPSAPAPAAAVVDWSLMLGPLRGITSLSGLPCLTTLTIGLHHLTLVSPSATAAAPTVQPPASSLLPPALRSLTLFVCVECWSAAAKWSAASIAFLDSLAGSREAGRLAALKRVGFYCRKDFWDPDYEDELTIQLPWGLYLHQLEVISWFGDSEDGTDDQDSDGSQENDGGEDGEEEEEEVSRNRRVDPTNGIIWMPGRFLASHDTLAAHGTSLSAYKSTVFCCSAAYD